MPRRDRSPAPPPWSSFPEAAARSWKSLALFLLLSSGCGQMGETCRTSDGCVDGGTCLKGVCSGYACETDEDCLNDHVCGQVFGARVCVLPCAGDGDCAGDQTCGPVAETLEGDAPTHDLCL